MCIQYEYMLGPLLAEVLEVHDYVISLILFCLYFRR